MKKQASAKGAVITGSVAVKENGTYYNRLFWVEPSGQVKQYDKRHLFRMAGEDTHYSAGREKIVVEYKGWKFCPLVCYDLRFPVWSRNRFKKTSDKSCTAEYDVLIYVANWPERRIHAWKQLLVARAIENQCYVIGVNRVGNDGNGYAHSGDSAVIDPKGAIISDIASGKPSLYTIELDQQALEAFRRSFPVGLDADHFLIRDA
jgi:predicted amidohydrolase